MNENVMTAAESRPQNPSREIVAVCDVFDLAKTKAWYAQRGYQPTGEWHYANRQETIIRVHFARPMVINFSIHDLVDDLLDLFIRGRITRRAAIQTLNVLQAQKGGELCA